MYHGIYFVSRWDVQRYRALKQREELQEKYKQREDARLTGIRKVIGLEEKAADDSFVPNYFESKWFQLAFFEKSGRLSTRLVHWCPLDEKLCWDTFPEYQSTTIINQPLR